MVLKGMDLGVVLKSSAGYLLVCASIMGLDYVNSVSSYQGKFFNLASSCQLACTESTYHVSSPKEGKALSDALYAIFEEFNQEDAYYYVNCEHKDCTVYIFSPYTSLRNSLKRELQYRYSVLTT